MIRSRQRRWTCITCGHLHRGMPRDVARESALCVSCGASWRVRATVLALLQGLRIDPRPLPDVGADWSRRGVGCSDHPALASRLPSRFLYTNTHLEKYPFLDVLQPPKEVLGDFEFVICSDVMEHVEPPYQRGFDGLASLLRPGGFAVVSVPLTQGDGEGTVEFYPGLRSFEVVEGPAVRWIDAEGEEHLDESPEMHGGDGLVLAFRRFVVRDVVKGLLQAGFDWATEPPVRPDLGVFAIANPGVFVARMPG